MAEGRRQKAEGRGQKAEGRRQKAEGRKQKLSGESDKVTKTRRGDMIHASYKSQGRSHKGRVKR
jgi:hypothetical protein